ncbi:hypothetical protein [Xenorhabdus ehlersii]|uniref:Uncharacterized protein n=1 Tax=Xenorhabdus ehlersii TaxID=290111 RepID=A0ABX9PGM8_9GAMM|nr:hypothetical protein [Xenorhabdus ehlersii]RKE90656.1 hypothetical protein BDE27_2537 [Xenorhabdus ehlersii]
MSNVFLADPLSELKNKAKDFVSVEDALNIICEMLDCSLVTAAEIILLKLPDDRYQSPLKMLDFLSKSDHACNHENSSDTRTKTRP